MMNETIGTRASQTDNTHFHKWTALLFDALLLILIITGIFFRFNDVNWSQGANLHPDEYGLTNTLTRLKLPSNLPDYFNTRLSTLSPYPQYDWAGKQLKPGPDNLMRWGQLPITIIRWAGEVTANTGYDEIRLLGRTLSALADTLTLLLIFLIGQKLYNHKVALLATALSALSVMQIQQSHFMTVDNFGALFTSLAMLACVYIAAARSVTRSLLRFALTRSAWYILFGLAFGMAVACKINLLPVGGMLLVAAFISAIDLYLNKLGSLQRIIRITFVLLSLGIITTAVTFRVAQPMSFRAASGDTFFFTLQPNPDWVDSMKLAQAESNGEGGGPPGEQWAHRAALLFPLVNMLAWGLGLPLGLAAWAGFGAALWQTVRRRVNWRSHLLPLVWTGGFFLFMATRWVKSMRYFLPIYPFLCLLAAWGLMETWKWAAQPRILEKNRPNQTSRLLFATILITLTLGGTLIWASAFTQAVYQAPHTRIQATRWIFQNIPGPLNLSLRRQDGAAQNEPLGAPDKLQISAARAYIVPFTLQTPGQLLEINLPHIQANSATTLRIGIAGSPNGNNILDQADLAITTLTGPASATFPRKIELAANKPYFLFVSIPSLPGTHPQDTVSIFRNTLANESWDETLPQLIDGRNPFAQIYKSTIMDIRKPDDAIKRTSLLNTLATADYLILPSQRSIWSTCRIPRTYPMTMEYYRALFDGRLGFEQMASFSAPIKLGPLWISDVGGTLAWNNTPGLPLFNHSLLAAEEAFSIYDHPPVWIFKKRADFSLKNATTILNSIDLAPVVLQSPPNANGDWCPAY